MRAFSKSKLMAWRQCPKRLWLELRRPELRADSAQTQARFAEGHKVGEIARQLYDPEGRGETIALEFDRLEDAFRRTAELMAEPSRPVFEAGFKAEGVLAFADVMVPLKGSRRRQWHMVEVKSSTRVKDAYLEDTAIQAFAARASGVSVASVALAHIDATWVYRGDGDYRGLLVEQDLTDDVERLQPQVARWIPEAVAVARKRTEPAIGTGAHCTRPYECGFLDYCRSREPDPRHPVSWLPGRLSGPAQELIDGKEIIELGDMPEDLLNPLQRRVRAHTLSGRPFFDAAAAAAALGAHRPPAWFLDFETIQFAVPRWKGTRPYQQIPFQFSVHRLSRTGVLTHRPFLDLSGDDPSRLLAEALIAACGERGPVFAYNASFEQRCIAALAERFPEMKRPLLAINARIVDLLRVARDAYYHPDQKGSWSLKSVLPTIAPDLGYDALDGVQDGGMAIDAYLEATDPDTPAARKQEIERQLLAYCEQDTLGLVRLWQRFAGAGGVCP